MKPFPSRVLVTGGAGQIGTTLRSAWSERAAQVVYTDIKPADPIAGNEQFAVADLADRTAIAALMDGVEAVVHLGGIARELGWDAVLHGNIEGTYNVYEAARRAGVKRVVYASSLHATGFYGVDEVIDPSVPVRPSSLYGVSKVFGEALARLYWDKFGIESLAVRIGSFGKVPNGARALRTWFSAGDFASMAERALTIDTLGFQLVYGVSANSRSWWRNPPDMLDGWQAMDSADDHLARIGDPRLDPERPEGRYQGAGFATVGHFDDGAPADNSLRPIFGLPSDDEKNGG